MLDLKFIRENPEKVKEGVRNKNAAVDIDALLKLDEEHRQVLRELETKRAEQNKKSKEARGETPELKTLKEAVKTLEVQEADFAARLTELLHMVPNLPLDGVPVAKDETGNVVLREVGERPKFDFAPKSYLEIAEGLDLIDTERAGKVSGTRFGYLKRGAVMLEFALVRLALDTLTEEGFVPIVPPVLVKPEAMRAMGYVERGGEEIYFIEKDALYLVGTSEQSVGPMHRDEIFDEGDLPRRYVAFSTCFRREAGSYGKDTKGILRVHQFDKVEMFSFVKPEDSGKEHAYLLSLQERLMQILRIPYRVVQICAGDLGDPAAAKYDIEAWLPGENTYRETHSTSNTTDYQARRLNIRYRSINNKKTAFVHTLNGTAFAIGRMIIVILENYQEKDGSVRIPEALASYLALKKIVIPSGDHP